MIETTKLPNDVHVTKIFEPKFNEVYTSIRILVPLKEELNTKVNLLTRLMGDRLVTNPTKKDLTARHDMLYGAKTHALTYTMGNYQVIDLGVKVIHERFVNENLLEKQIELLADMMFMPLLNDETLEEVKRNLKQSHAHVKESPSQYAVLEAFKRAGKGQVFGLNAMGTASDIDMVSVADIKEIHTMIIDSCYKELFIVGDVPQFPNISRFNEGKSAPLMPILTDTVLPNYIEEVYHRGSQTEIVSVYQTSIKPYDPLYAAYLVFIAVLGQLPTSLLFQNIREKESLCYSIYASRQMFDSTFYIATGVNDTNVDKAQKLILEQFEILRKENVDIEGAITYLSMSLEGQTESLRKLADFEFRNHVLGTDDTLKSMQDKLQGVTHDDMKRVLETITEPYTFIYRGEHENA